MKGISVRSVSVRGAFLVIAGFAAACALFYGWPAAEAQVPPTKIVVVDVNTVFTRSKMGKAVYDQLKKQQEDLVRQVSAETDAAKRQQMAKDADAKITEARDRAIATADIKIMPIIDAVGKEQKAAAIFRKFDSGIVYVDDALDITNIVIQRLDAATP